MTIETKYNPQDKVFRMKDNKILEDTIEEVVIKVKKHGDAAPYYEETYTLKFGGGGYYGHNFYPTKELLLASL